MKHKNAGERKRTVTVTLGDRTSELVDLLVADYAKRNGGMLVERTTMVSAALYEGLYERLKLLGVSVDRSWTNCYS